ncbi:MAG: hypothetical protein RRY18_03905, partial [Clostridia bacterium]
IKKSVFVDNKYITRLDEGLNATVFETDKELLLLVGNVSQRSGEVEITAPFKVKSIKATDINMQDVSQCVKAVDNKVTVNTTAKIIKVEIQM